MEANVQSDPTKQEKWAKFNFSHKINVSSSIIKTNQMKDREEIQVPKNKQ